MNTVDSQVVYQELTRIAGYPPQGKFPGNLSFDSAVKYLSSRLTNEEKIIALTTVRYKGINSFLVITQRQVICFSEKETLFTEGVKNISKVLTGENGLIFKRLHDLHSFYFINLHSGSKFISSLKVLSLIIEEKGKIKKDGHEVKLELFAYSFFVFLAFVFGSCTYRVF